MLTKSQGRSPRRTRAGTDILVLVALLSSAAVTSQASNVTRGMYLAEVTVEATESPEPNLEKIATVETVDLKVLPGDPPRLEIRATGKTRSTGWHNGTLQPRRYVFGGVEGVYHFDFVAEPPPEGKKVGLGFTEIRAEREFPLLKDLTAVTVHAEKNSKTAKRPSSD